MVCLHSGGWEGLGDKVGGAYGVMGGRAGHEVSQVLFHAYWSGPGVRPESLQRVGCKAPADRNCD